MAGFPGSKASRLPRSQIRRLSTWLAVILTAAGLQATGTLPAAADPSCADSAPDVASAASMASECGHAVEALSRHTPSSRLWLNPDGTSSTDEYATAHWARQADGTWGTINTTLSASGGSITPALTVLPVTFSTGGSGAFATVRDGVHRLSLTWPGQLPAPTLAGDTATYAEVLPGVDLTVTARAEGFSEMLVVKDANAASNPDLAEINFGIDTDGVTLSTTSDGGMQATDDRGNVIFSSPQPLMWDASGGDQATGAASQATPSTSEPDGGGTPRTAVMEAELNGSQLTLTPDQDLLTDPATVFPVYLDPTFTGHKSDGAWAVVSSRSDLASHAYWKTTFMTNASMYGDTGSGLTCDSSSGGSCTSSTYKVRSFFRMETYTAAGATITSASFAISQKWSWTCNPASNAKLWITGGISSSTTWNNQPDWLSDYTAQTAAGHAAGGANGCSDTGTISFDATTMVQHAYAQGWPNLTLGLRAVDETTNNQWKRFDASTAALHIVYDRAPATPTLSQMGMGDSGQIACGVSSTAPTHINTTHGLDIRATLTDPDSGSGDLVKASWAASGIDSQYVPAAETSGLTSGSTHQATIPAAAFTDGTVVSWQVRGVDTDSNMVGGWSPPCYLQVDNAVPGPPTMASTDLNLRIGLGIVPGAAATAIVGQPATITFGPDPNDTTTVVGYRYGVAADADPTPSMWAAARKDGTTAASVVPLEALSYNEVVAVAVKSDGTTGAPTTAKFRANPSTNSTAVLNDATGDGRADITTLADVGSNTSVFWRWQANASGTLAAPVAPQDVAGIYTSSATLTGQGDVDGDGLADMVVLTQSGSNVDVAVERSDGDQLLSSPVLATLSGWSLSNCQLVVGDFSGDGLADAAVIYSSGSVGWELRVLVATSTPGNPSFAATAVWDSVVGVSAWSQIKIVAGDFNGDGKADIAEFHQYTGAQTKLFMHYSTGTSFQSGALQWDSGTGNFSWSQAKFAAGDFNNDGKTDAAALYNYGSSSVGVIVFPSDSNGEITGGSLWWGQSGSWTWDWGSTELSAGDITGDGNADVGLIYHCCGSGQARAWTLASTGTTLGAPATSWSGTIGALGSGALPQDNPNQAYHLVAQHSSKCLDVPGAATTDDLQLQQWTCNGTPQQEFTLQPNGGGQYRIQRADVTAKCVGVPSNSTADGAAIAQDDCGQTWQNLQLTYVSGGINGQDTLVKIQPMFSGKCVDVAGADTADGALVKQWTCNGQLNQTFKLEPVA